MDLPAVLYDVAPPIYLADQDGILIFTSPAFEEIAGLIEPPPTLAISAEDEPARHGPGADAAPDDPADETTPPWMAAIFARLRSHPGEDIIRIYDVSTDAGMRTFRARHYLRARADAPPVFAGEFTDITAERAARKRAMGAAERLGDALRATVDWVWETDHNLNLTFVSTGITRIAGELPDTLTGRNLFALGRFAEMEDSTRSQREMLARQLPFRDRLFLMQGQDGRERRIALAGVPVFDDATGRFAGYRGTGADVTQEEESKARARKARLLLKADLEELRELNIQLDRALVEARSLAEAKTDFLGKMSHELRTPLNAIIGFSEMSVRQVFGALDERYLGYFRDIGGAAGHLLEIINDILDAVSLDSKQVAIEARPISIAQVIQEARSLIVMRAEERGIDISAISPVRDFTANADAGRARQIFLNLLSNAIKNTPEGGKIGVDTKLHGTGEVDITVWDTGIGIHPDQHSAIFESFHQVGGGVETRPEEGTGLGLSVSRQLARLMGGDITVESAPGQGARFTVRLPLAAGSGSAQN